MPCEFLAAHFYSSNEPVSDEAVACVCNQRIHRRLPSGLRNACSDFGAGNNACIAFRERNENQYSRLIFVVRKPTAGELLHGNTISYRATRLVWNKRDTYARQAKQK